MIQSKFLFIAGPCVVESKELLLTTVSVLKPLMERHEVDFIFKSSYKKANRTSAESFTGLGDTIALEYLAEIRKEFNVRVLTDVHTPEEAEKAAYFVDVLQIPAFLCRQTELLEAAGRTGKPVNIKKGQFMAPEDMLPAIEKVLATGNSSIMLTERGTTFGYHDLVVDYRSLVKMKQFGFPVLFDATHSVQQPSAGKQSGGLPQYIFPLSKAAVSVGVDGIFFETHPEPLKAKSDAATQLSLDLADSFVQEMMKYRKIAQSV